MAKRVSKGKSKQQQLGSVELQTSNGATAVMKIVTAEDGEPVVLHYTVNARGKKSRLTCTCTCPNGKASSGQCATGNYIKCDCSGSVPLLTCS